MTRRQLRMGLGLAISLALTVGTTVSGQSRPGMAKPDKDPPKRETPKESRKEPRPEPRREPRPEPRRETRPEPRRETRPEPPRSMPRNDGGNRGSSGRSNDRDVPAGRPVKVDGKNDEVRVGNGVSFEKQREQNERERIEAEQRRQEREKQEQIERERDAREEAEFKERQQLEDQRLAALRQEIERLEATDRALANERRLELRRREQAWRDREDERRRARDLARERRDRLNFGAFAPVAPGKPAKPPRDVKAKPGKPVLPPAAPLSAEQLAAALVDLESGELKQELAALELLAKAAADENRAKVALAIEPHLNKADPVKRKAAAKALAVWASVEQVPAVLALLPELDKETRHDAIATLGILKDARSIGALADRLTIPQDRQAAVEALQACGPAAAPAAAKKLSHDEMWVRAAAIDVLGEVGGAENKDALKELAENDPEAFVRNKASNAVRQLGG